MKSVFLNNKAFTLLEALVGLVVMAIIVVLILQMMVVINTNYNEYYNEQQIILFTMQIQEELVLTKEVEITNGNLYLEMYDSDVVSYEFQNGKIVRQVNGKGGEVALYNVESGFFYLDENDVIWLNIKFNDEKSEDFIIGTKKTK